LVANNSDPIHFADLHREVVPVFISFLPLNIVIISIGNSSTSCHHIHFIHSHSSFDMHLIVHFIHYLHIVEELFVFCLNYYYWELFCLF